MFFAAVARVSAVLAVAGSAIASVTVSGAASAQSARAIRTEPSIVRPTASRDSADAVARFGQLMAAINSIDVNTKRFLGISGLRPAQLDFVDVRHVLRGDLALALEPAVMRQERRITAMRNDLQNSFLLRDALVARDIPMSQVIAVDVAPDATRATIYYRTPGS